jgi:hypothetical protein
MINWFLWKIGRHAPSAQEVVQVARVHVARSVIKRAERRGDMTSMGASSSSASASSAGAVLGKRPWSDGGAEHGGPHTHTHPHAPPPPPDDASGSGARAPELYVPVSYRRELHEWLVERYPGEVDRAAVMDAVDKGVWQQDQHGFLPNLEALDRWTTANGLWQHFAQHCLASGIKHDQSLFSFSEQAPSRSSKFARIRPKADVAWRGPSSTHAAAYQRRNTMSSSSSSASASASSLAQQRHHHQQMMMAPHHRPDLDSLIEEFEAKLCERVRHCSRSNLRVKYRGSRRHPIDLSRSEEWVKQFRGQPDVIFLFPYFMRLEHDAKRRNVMLTHPATERMTHVGVYTFEYGVDRFLTVFAYLVSDGQFARFSARYLLSSADKLLMPYECVPVSLDPTGKSALLVHHDDLTSFRCVGHNYMMGRVSCLCGAVPHPGTVFSGRLWYLAEQRIGNVRALPPQELADALEATLTKTPAPDMSRMTKYAV